MGFDKMIYSWTVLFPLVVLLYYFFRKKYEVKTISSTLFWEESMRETKVSPYLKNLQRNLLFYLQMAALLLLVFVLLNPFVQGEETLHEQTIIIVDTSASMLAGKEQSLFAKHKAAAVEFVKERTDQSITIVTTGREPSTLIREETNNEVVISAIESLEVTYEHEFMERALEFTQSIAADSGADIHIFTDSLDRQMLPEGNDLVSWTVNASEKIVSNVSIDKFGAVQTPEGTEAIIKLVNYSESDMDGNVLLTDALTGSTLDKKNFAVEGKQELLVSFKNLADGVALMAEIVTDDEYKADNTASVLLGTEITGVVVDAQLHELVKKAFEAVGLQVTTGSVNELTIASEESIVVTNDVTFLEMGTEPIILIGRNDRQPEQAKGAITASNDPLFSIADITDVYVSEVYPSFESFETIATIGDKPFIQKSQRGDIVVLSDVEMTDWPLHPSFPLFMWGVVEVRSSEGNSLGSFIPNERKAVMSGGTTGKIEVYTTEDEYVTTILEPSSFIAPSLPGIYKARDGDREKLFSVQLESAEKALKQGTSLRIGQATIAGEVTSSKRMLGAFFILPILFLMLMEWEVQRRRGYPT